MARSVTLTPGLMVKKTQAAIYPAANIPGRSRVEASALIAGVANSPAQKFFTRVFKGEFGGVYLKTENVFLIVFEDEFHGV